MKQPTPDELRGAALWLENYEDGPDGPNATSTLMHKVAGWLVHQAQLAEKAAARASFMSQAKALGVPVERARAGWRQRFGR